MNTTSRTLPALEEIKNCEKAMNKINKKWFDNETQEQYFEARKQLWLYRKEMRMQAERLIKAIDEAEARDREHYAQNASSPNEKMMRDFILNDQ